MKQYLVIDIGGTHVKFALMDVKGTILKRAKVDSKSENLIDFMQKIKAVCDTYQDEFEGIAISAPGKVDAQTNTLYFGGSLPFLDGVNFQKLLGDQYNVPISLENDGKCAVLAEYWLGNLKKTINSAVLVLGTGVSGGIIINGQLLRGSHFQAGEVSFMKANTTRHDWHGMYGSTASAVELIEEINQLKHQAELTDGKKAFEYINAHDPQVWPVFEKYCYQVACLILNIQTVVDLEKYAIGGGISAQPIVIETIKKQYEKLLDEDEMLKNTLTPPQIVTTKFKNDANLYGALYSLIQLKEVVTKH